MRKGEKGSITLFALVMCLLMLVILVLINMKVSNKSISQEKNLEKIMKEYSADEAKMDETYAKTIGSTEYVTIDQVKALISEVKLDIYPVGSIYISTNSANPSTYIGGSWESYGQGKTLVGIDSGDSDFSSVNKTGGEKNHTLSINEMPKHSGHFTYWGSNEETTSVDAEGEFGYYIDALMLKSAGYLREYTGRGWGITANNELSMRSWYIGGSKAHNNLQPYIVTYIWKRTK